MEHVENNRLIIPTPSPIPTSTPGPVIIGDVAIAHIHYDGYGSQEPDEYVEIRNDDTFGIQLQGWTLRDKANHVFAFPNYVMLPGQVYVHLKVNFSLTRLSG